MTKSAAEYLPSAGEEVPTTPGQGSGSNGKDTHSSGAGDGVWRRTTLAYIRAAEDPRLDDLAVRVFVWLLERTFDFKERGDGDGGIIAEVKKIAERIKRPSSRRTKIRVPKRSNGKCVGLVKRQREEGPEHPKPKAVARSLDQLEGAGYIWRERLRVAGWPTKKIFISSILPKSIQRDLFEGSRKGTHESSPQGTHESSPQGTHESSPQGTRMSSPKGTTVRTGSGSTGRGSEPTPPRLSILDLKDRLMVLTENIKALRSKPDNYKRVLKKAVAEWIADAEAKLPSLDKSRKAEDRQRAADYRAKIERSRADASNYEKAGLTPTAAATLANFTRKKEETERALMGLDE